MTTVKANPNSAGLTEYSVWLRDPTGNLLNVLDNFISFEYSHTVNSIGAFTLVLPDPDYPAVSKIWNNIFKNGQIWFWRSVQGGPLGIDAGSYYLTRRRRRILNANGERTIVLSGVDLNDILNRRIVAYASGSQQAKKVMAADDMLKSMFYDNFGTGAAVGRNLSTYITYAPNYSLAHSESAEFANKKLLKAMQDVAASAANDGTYLAFDISLVSGASAPLAFRTYVGQRGSDRRGSSGNPLILGPDFGNMSDYSVDEDWSKENTAIYGGANGFAQDTTREIGPFGRVEDYYQTQGNSLTEQNWEATCQLRRTRSKVVYSGNLVQTPNLRYGLQYGFGDYLPTQFAGVSADCRLDSVNIKVEAGTETVTGLLRSEV
jgi:hypothetical protein